MKGKEKHVWVSTSERPKIDVTKIPPIEIKNLCRSICEVMERFYADPENVKKFEAWKAERDAGVAV